MTAQETIQGLKNLFSEHELDLPCMDSLEILHMAIEALEKMAGIERALERLEEKETELRKARHSLSFEMYANSKAYEKAKVLTQKEITLHEAIEIIKQNCFNT